MRAKSIIEVYAGDPTANAIDEVIELVVRDLNLELAHEYNGDKTDITSFHEKAWKIHSWNLNKRLLRDSRKMKYPYPNPDQPPWLVVRELNLAVVEFDVEEQLLVLGNLSDCQDFTWKLTDGTGAGALMEFMEALSQHLKQEWGQSRVADFDGRE